MKNILLLSSVTCLFFWTCKSKSYTLDNLPDKQIAFGEGGGFTGKYTNWLLLDSGQLFEKSGIGGEYEQIGILQKKEVKSLYKMADSIPADLMVKNRPGNYNYSLNLQRDSTKLAAEWSNESDIDAVVLSFYKQLKKATVKLKTTADE